jgi:hypothetical protein
LLFHESRLPLCDEGDGVSDRSRLARDRFEGLGVPPRQVELSISAWKNCMIFFDPSNSAVRMWSGRYQYCG